MATNVKEMVLAELDNVPDALLPEVLRFVRFIKAQSGDALADTEHLGDPSSPLLH
jgi:hypothetical protein